MQVIVFASLVLAAFLHALWNFIAHKDSDPERVLILMMFSSAVFSAFGVLSYGFVDKAFWPLLAVSLGVHTGYKYFLCKAYKDGPLSLCYPLARGLAPVYVLTYSLVFLDDILSFGQYSTIVVLVLGLLLLVVSKLGSVLYDKRVIAFSALTALMIALYTVIDGNAVQKADSAHPYLFSLMLLDSLIFMIYGLMMRGKKIFAADTKTMFNCIIGGVANALSYWIALWAIERSTIVGVAAIRELSILFAVLIVSFFNAEKINLLGKIAIFLIVLATMGVRFLS